MTEDPACGTKSLLFPSDLCRKRTVFFYSLSSTSGSPAVHESVLVLDGQTGQLPLQLAEAGLGCQVGAQQQPTQDVSGRDESRGEEGGTIWRLS